MDVRRHRNTNIYNLLNRLKVEALRRHLDPSYHTKFNVYK